MSRRRGFNGNGHDQVRYDVGALEQRVYGLESALTGISQQIGNLSTKIDERSRTPWSVIWGAAGVVVVVLGLIGGILYRPIESGLGRLEATQNEDRKALTLAVQTIGKEFVTIRELDARTARGQSDFARINADLRQLNENVVPRNELTERWRSTETQQLNLQRQIDDQKKQFGDTFSLRDALQIMQRRIDALEGRKAL